MVTEEDIVDAVAVEAGVAVAALEASGVHAVEATSSVSRRSDRPNASSPTASAFRSTPAGWTKQLQAFSCHYK